MSLYNHAPSFSSPSYEYLLLPWADISFSCLLESAPFASNSGGTQNKRDVLLQMFILYIIVLHLFSFQLVLSHDFFCFAGQISQISFLDYGLHISNYVC